MKSLMSSIPQQGLVLVDGRRCLPAEATVSVYDRGFLYGDSVFEVIRTYGGRPFGLRDHVERLHRSAKKLEMTLPWTVDSMIEEIEGAVAASGFAEVYVRVVVTRGSGPLGLDPDLAEDPLRVVIVHPLVLPDASVYRDGVAVSIVESIRATDGTVAEGAKASNYLANLLSLREAKRRGAYEPVFVRRRGETIEVLEGGTSNVFALFGKTLVTPPEGRILAGITRHYVLEAAKDAGLEPRIEPILLDRLLAADEVFLTSTIREVVPVVRVLRGEEGHFIGSGTPGNGVRALHTAFRKRVGAPTSPMPWESESPKNG
jgi:branched-chain amino acid aminotransferase